MLVLPSLIDARRAFSLIEAAIVLGLIGLVIGGIWAASAAVNEHFRVSEAKKGILSIVQNVSSLYYHSSEGVGGIDSTVIAAKAAPAHWIKNNSLVDPWGKPLNISYDHDSGTGCEITDTPMVIVDFQNMSLKSCIALVSWGRSLYPKQVINSFVGYEDGDGYCGAPEPSECQNLFDGNMVRIQLLFSSR